ncbi:hypothetical protein K8I28_08990 [bacterium]|nr:hypothetical protein [bacterium]
MLSGWMHSATSNMSFFAVMSTIMFFFGFLMVLYRVITMKKSEVLEMGYLPLDDDPPADERRLRTKNNEGNHGEA